LKNDEEVVALPVLPAGTCLIDCLPRFRCPPVGRSPLWGTSAKPRGTASHTTPWVRQIATLWDYCYWVCDSHLTL